MREWTIEDSPNPLLFELLAKHRSVIREGDDVGDRTAFVLNGTLNHSTDVQSLLLKLRAEMRREDRALVVAYNPYLSWLYAFANALGVRSGPPPTTFVTRADLENLARLSGFDVVRYRPAIYIPFSLFGLATLINRLLVVVPLIRHLALTSVITLRPREASGKRPSLTVVIPARNERGNIAAALDRMPDFDAQLEIIFVEGGSSDGTWEEIQRVVADQSSRFSMKAIKQPGRGKGDAVRAGFAIAGGELLTILDADLTMPPELLPRFYDAYVDGHADFVNGSRLLYPMEGEAMRPLNHVGNVFFAKALSYVLDTRLTDSLCGTKLLSRADWRRMQRWRDDFGEFDPFGDFELLFPAAILGTGIVDIPVRYRDRTYGTTNISRFRHGFQLLRMTMIGFLRVKIGKGP